MLVHSVAYFMQMMWYLFVLACVNCKKMVALCINEFISIDMLVNAKKCHVIRFGCRYLSPCIQVSVQNKLIDYAEKVKYLGVILRAYKSFSVDIHFMKTKFYRAFNSIFDRAGKLKDELISVQLINSFCKPYLLYATECMGLGPYSALTCTVSVILGNQFLVYSTILENLLTSFVVLWRYINFILLFIDPG